MGSESLLAILILRQKRKYQKWKKHGKADARGLTGAEIAEKELKAHEAAASREWSIATQEEEEQVLVAETPPRQVSLSIKSPEAVRSRPTPNFRLFPDYINAETSAGYLL